KKKKQNSGFLKENQTLKSSQLPDQQVKDKTSVNLKNLHSTKSMAYPSQALIADVKELTTDSGRNINKIAFIIAGIVLIFILLITGSIWYITSINPIYYIYMAKKEKGKNNPSAIKYCKKALNINNNPEFHKVLLDIYMTDEQYYEAAKKELDIMKDVENNDENIETYLNGKYFALGNKFYTLKKYHLAVECFEKLKLDSININTDIIKIIAQSYINTNNKKEAINFYIKRINKLTETEKDDKSIESIYYLDEIIKLEIDDSHIEDLFKIAQKYKNYKKTEEAIKIYTVLKEKEIAKAEASLELGDIYYYQKEYDKAISNYTTAKASLSPKNSTKLSHVKSQLVECYIAIEDYSKALNLLKSIIKNGDTSKKSRFYKLCITLGDKYYTNGNIKKAVEYYTEVDKNSSEFKLLQEKLNKYAENYLKKAYDYKEKKSYEEGKKYCNKILSLQNFIKPEHKDKAENYLEEIEEATRPVQPAYTYPYNGSTPNKPYEPNPPPDNHPNPINPLN
ncbi:MAG TPA: hypothetical protein PL110_08985, partial [Candidatus Eremiobacteraeota bacterium]|nr:hypothetical protein [Candidatus Eremiobacteraeota bacterium]